MMQTWGAEVLASPTNLTEFGRKILAEDLNSPGSLGIAISEAVEEAASRADTKYSLGSVLNHVLLHQTVIGLEAKSSWRKSANIRTWCLRRAAAVPTSAGWRSRSLPITLPAKGAAGGGGTDFVPEPDARPLCLRFSAIRRG